MDAVIRQALTAIQCGDVDALRRTFHPYIRWTDSDGVTIRGRTKVLARLAVRPPTGPPSSYEFRDDQLYRWVE